MNNYAFLDLLQQLLLVERFLDYCPNGLQVEGAALINKIITGVSLSDDLIEAAIAENANTIIVHHGLLWNNDNLAITRVKKQRIAKLLKHDINLYAYHLPLDNHNELGNNVQLAKQLGIDVIGSTDKQNLLWYGNLHFPCQIDELLIRIKQKLNHDPRYFPSHSVNNKQNKTINSIAWCTGAADRLFSAAIALGVDVYLTGECSEPVMSLAKESGVWFIAAGHYATERFGILALTEYINKQLNLDAKFVELYNPI